MTSETVRRRPARVARLPRRLLILSGVLLLLGGVLVAQRLWLSPEAHERQLASTSRSRLERDAERGSSDPVLYFVLARKRLEVGDVTAARAALEEALRLRPRYVAARSALGSVLASLDEDAEAVLHFKQAIRDDPASPDPYLGLALLYQKNHAWHLQGPAAEMASELDPKSAAAWMLRGEAAAQQSDHGQAVEFFTRAAVVAPADPQPRARAAWEQLQLGRFREAESLAREAIALQPKFAPAHAALGDALLRQGASHLAEAEAAYSRAVSLGEPTGTAQYGLARVLQRLNRPVEAEQHLRLARRLRPADSQVYFALAQTLRSQGKEADAKVAEREFRRWEAFNSQAAQLNDRVALHPDDAAAWFALARLHGKMELWAEARRFALAGLRRAPADPEGTRILQKIDRDGR
jgi:tetratricopeptide (TPR) repeat protein